MSCRLFEGGLDAYFDGELNAQSSTVIREHLDKCWCCRERLAERAALASLVRAAPFYSAPDRLRARVLAQARIELGSLHHRVLTLSVDARTTAAGPSNRMPKRCREYSDCEEGLGD